MKERSLQLMRRSQSLLTRLLQEPAQHQPNSDQLLRRQTAINNLLGDLRNEITIQERGEFSSDPVDLAGYETEGM